MRALALLLTGFTGFSGLVYEITWQKYLATLLGAHSEATAAVLAIFLGGLALGYSAFGRITETLVARAECTGRPPRLLLLYGLVEASIGAYAFAFPALFRAAQFVSVRLPAAPSALGFGLDVVLATFLIGPPTVLMGATIPVLTQALSRGLHDATRVHALIYGTNTAGAFAGALSAGFVLVPFLGLVRVLWWMGLINLTAGLCFVGLYRRQRSHPPGQPAAEGALVVKGLPLYLAVALLSGFAMMTVQTALIRLGGLAFGSSYFTFSMVVAVFVLCIAIGSFAVSSSRRIPAFVLVANQWLLAAFLFALYPLLESSGYLAHVLRSVFRDISAGWLPFQVLAFAGILAVIGIPVILAGAVLPLIFDRLRHQAADLGSVAGRVYGWNTVGSLLGALLGGYVLYFWLDLHAVYRVAVGCVVVSASLLTAPVPRVRWLAAGAAVLILVGLVMTPAWHPERLAAGLFRRRTPMPVTYASPFDFWKLISLDVGLVFYTDDPIASVAVRKYRMDTGEITHAIINNGKPDGSLRADYPTMALAGLVPALLSRGLERAFVIGWGTGVTAGELAALDPVKEVVVAEISSGVMQAAPFFEYGNQHALASPKTRVVRSDAYRALLRSRGDFDVIVSEPSNPWVMGVEMLYSREFLAAARDRLAPGGVYSQWFHTYEVDDATIALVLRTYADVFEQVGVWYADGPDLLLLGFTNSDPSEDLERLLERAARPDFEAGLRRSDITDLGALLTHEILPRGVVHASGLDGPIHTLLHPILSHWAARAFFAGQDAQLPHTAGLQTARVGAAHSLMRRYRERLGGPPTEKEYAAMARHLCAHRYRECVALLARWRHAHPDSGALLEIVEARGGQNLRLDLIDRVATFYGSGTEPEGVRTLQQAYEASDLFTRYYYHAFPFERASLDAVWTRCLVTDAIACAEGRVEVQRLLGDLRVSASIESDAPAEARPSGRPSRARSSAPPQRREAHPVDREAD